MRIFIILFLFTCYAGSLTAQTIKRCLTPEMDSIAFSNDPSILERRAELESFTRQYQNQHYKSYDKLVVPIVFHVLHQYGKERISIEQIQKGIDQLNKDYSAQNSDLQQTIADFYGIIGTVNVEFRLAQVDPNGNPTTGVIYYDTELTYNATDEGAGLKTKIKSWDPTKYLNVWSVASIKGSAAAWSYYPGVSAYLDGVVSIYTYIYSTHTLAHEIGHYLNLRHPWGNSNEPGLASNCNDDDLVEDTPNTIGSKQTCILDQVSCGSLDNVQNIMDYSTCDCMLTMGQVDRMRAALNSGVNGRKNLWTEVNRMATGTNDGYITPVIKPIADFSSIKQIICPGTAITFSSYDDGGEAIEWNWEFEGGSPATSTEQSPVVTYNQSGSFKVKLTVANDAGTNSLVRDSLITVSDVENGFTAPVTINFEDATEPFYNDEPAKTWYSEDDGNANWEWSTASSNKAFRINNASNNAGIVNNLISPSINLSNITPPDFIYFNWAYAQKSSTSADVLKVFVSTNCGDSWILRFSKSARSLVTNDGSYITSEFIPTAEQWKEGKLDITSYKTAKHIELKFAMESRKGNYLYIDNVKVGETSGVADDNIKPQQLEIYPNPAHNFTIAFKLDKAGTVKYSITNSIGKTVASWTKEGFQGLNKEEVTPADLRLPAGVYYVTIVNQQFSNSKKVLVY